MPDEDSFRSPYRGDPGERLRRRDEARKERERLAREKSKKFKDEVTDPIKVARQIRQRRVTDYVYQLAGLPTPMEVKLGAEDDGRVLPPGLRRFLETDAQREARTIDRTVTNPPVNTGGGDREGGGGGGGFRRPTTRVTPPREPDQYRGTAQDNVERERARNTLDPFPAPRNRFDDSNRYGTATDRYNTTPDFYDPFGTRSTAAGGSRSSTRYGSSRPRF